MQRLNNEPIAGRIALSVVIPTRDRPDLLRGCLARLDASLDPGDEIIVADSNSRSPRLAVIAQSHGARYVRCEVPGISHARNEGWRAARHDVVAFVDDDVRVEPGWADAIRSSFERPDVAFVTGLVDVAEGADAGWATPVKRERDEAWLDGTTTGVIGHGANHAVRRVALEKIGGYDELLGTGTRFGSAEDLDLFDRLFAAGGRGLYQPAAAVMHEQWRDKRQNLRVEWKYGLGIGARLRKRWLIDRASARALTRETMWTFGVRSVVRRVRTRNRYGALAMTIRLAGMAVGFVATLPRRVVDGHLR